GHRPDPRLRQGGGRGGSEGRDRERREAVASGGEHRRVARPRLPSTNPAPLCYKPPASRNAVGDEASVGRQAANPSNTRSEVVMRARSLRLLLPVTLLLAAAF